MTDRQTDAPYAYRLDKLCGTGKFEKSNWGGYDNKFRKLRGIGMYSNGRNSWELGDTDQPG